MNKEFVPYELSVKLKELGFNESCFARFNNYGDLLIAHTEKYIIDNGVDRSEFFTLAPLHQQAFRWFREKYGLVGIVKFGTNDFTYNIYNVDGIGLLTKESLNFNGTYQEAELACLEKLIEIAEKS
jgi:hypothetical protein